MTAKERVLGALAGARVDRLPVVIPGGMMCAATQDLVRQSGLAWEAVNREPRAMASFASQLRETVGLDNVGVPFSMTVEAEALGSTIELGSPLQPPRVEREAFPDLPTRPLEWSDGRSRVVVEAVRLVAEECPDVAVVGNVVGPVSVGAMVVEPGRFWRALRRRADEAERFLEEVTGLLISFARQQVRAGADVVVISEPSGTGEILGPVAFERFVQPNLNALCQAVGHEGARSVVHICGQVRSVARLLASLRADALSVDAIVQVGLVREAGCRLPLMGNLSTFLLDKGPVEAIRRAVESIRAQGFRVLAPACGVSGATPLEHLRALVGAAITSAELQGRR